MEYPTALAVRVFAFIRMIYGMWYTTSSRFVVDTLRIDMYTIGGLS